MGLSRYTKKIRRQVKATGRQVLKVHARIGKVVRPVVATGLTALWGPAAGALYLGASHYAHQYSAAAGARSDGIKGHAARTAGRSMAQRSTLYGGYGVAVGTAANIAIGGLGAGLTGLHGQSVLGLGSGQGVLGLSNPFMNSPGATLTTITDGAGTVVGVHNPVTGQTTMGTSLGLTPAGSPNAAAEASMAAYDAAGGPAAFGATPGQAAPATAQIFNPATGTYEYASAAGVSSGFSSTVGGAAALANLAARLIPKGGGGGGGSGDPGGGGGGGGSMEDAAGGGGAPLSGGTLALLALGAVVLLSKS